MQENTDKIVSDIYNKSFEKYLEVKFHKNVPKQLAKLINDNLPDPSSFEKREGIEVLKLGRQRFVYRTFLNNKIYSSMIVKLFPLRNPASFIKYKNMPLENMQIARLLFQWELQRQNHYAW